MSKESIRMMMPTVAERLTRYWIYCKPNISDHIYADPICDDFISIQDITNDMQPGPIFLPKEER